MVGFIVGIVIGSLFGVIVIGTILEEVGLKKKLIWHPVEEAMPDNEEKVLCCTVNKKGQKNIVLGYYIKEKDYWACGMNSNVIAWMPLPDPYVKEE